MDRNSLVNAALVLVLLATVGLAFYSYSYRKNVIPESADKMAVNSTGGSLSVIETPIPPESSTAAIKPVSNQSNTQQKIMNKVNIETNFGKIVLELYPKDAPKTVENFKTLANKGFYNGLIFHRVISGFMIQGGDPLGSGMGGPGYQFADELDPNTPSAKAGYKKGVLAMANSGPNTNGSQFFIMLADYPLPHNYTIFGRVIFGQDVVDKIGTVKTGANDRPVTPVVMKTVTVAE